MSSDPSFTIATWTTILVRLCVIFGIAALVGAVACLVYWRTRSYVDPRPLGRGKFVDAATVLLGVALIGALVGDLSGSSQESIAGQLIPAILTLIGVFAVYLFGKNHDQAGLINLAVLAFMVSLSVAYSNGLILKNDKDAFLFCRDKYSTPDIIKDAATLDQFNKLFGIYCSTAIERHTGK